MDRRLQILSLSVIAAAALAACGGGSTTTPTTTNTPGTTTPTTNTTSGTTTTTTSASAALTGVVVDGLIGGAVVCLDLNTSLSCDAGEPSATTKSDGSYALDITGLSAAALKNAQVFVTVSENAKDADDGGKSLKDVGKAAFNLMAPADTAVGANGEVSSSGVVVSPMTTLVSHAMLDGTSAEAAKALVKNIIGAKSDADLTQNYVGKPDPTSKDLAIKAQILAAALGQVNKTIASEQVSSTSQERLLGALAHLRANAAAIINAASTSGQAPNQAVQSALQTSALAPKTTELVKSAQNSLVSSATLGGVTTGIDTVLAEGQYEIYCRTSNCLEQELYVSKAVAAGQWESTLYSGQLPSTGFKKATAQITGYSLLEGAGWVGNGSNPRGGSYTVDSTGLATVTVKLTDNQTQSFRTRFTYKDVSGKKLSEVTGISVDQNTVFPSGSKRIQSTSEYSSDLYGIGIDQVVAYNHCENAGSCIDKPLNTFEELLAMFSTPAGTDFPNRTLPLRTVASNNSSDSSVYHATFDPESKSDTGGTMTVWRNVATSGFSFTKVPDEKATYTIKTIAGEKVLFITPSASALALRYKNTGTTLANETLFGTRGGKLYYGGFRSAQAQSLSSRSSQWNKTAAEAIVKAMGASALPQ